MAANPYRAPKGKTDDCTARLAVLKHDHEEQPKGAVIGAGGPRRQECGAVRVQQRVALGGLARAEG